MIGCEAMATRFVPSEGVFTLLDPVFDFSPTVVSRNYFIISDGWDERSIILRLGHA